MDQRDVVVVAEQAHDLLGLVEPQQAVVDEHALQLVAQRLVQQHGHHRGVDAARQAADHAALADLGADLGDGAVLEGGHRPVALEARDVEREVAQKLGAVGRVHHLGMELHAVELARLVGDGGERRVLRGGDDAEARRQLGHAIAVAHPDLLLVARLPHAVEQGRGLLDLEARRGRTRGGGPPRPCRRAAGPWSARRSRCPGWAPGRRRWRGRPRVRRPRSPRPGRPRARWPWGRTASAWPGRPTGRGGFRSRPRLRAGGGRSAG